MVSDAPVSSGDDDNNVVVMEKPVSRSSPNKKNLGKVPKKIHKAEREKLKRDNMNVLYLELAKTLEPAHQNGGKASTISESIRLLQDLLAQVDNLKRENATLSSESRYITVEKKELKEENSALQVQIEKLRSEIEERVRCQLPWNLDPSQLRSNTIARPQLEDHLVLPIMDHASQPAPVVAPVFVMPLPQDLQTQHEPDSLEAASKLPASVTRPHARYPSPSDSWPSHILAKQSKATHHTCSHSSSSSTSSREDQGFCNQ
ncbi:unnamed protein product [Ilex paraguariensis]|uniref:BHLH domain-containing protein n=1 Tax=Ilex paraguariensis TaxID=185542 RepID=A0ABC8T737_9AQUA